MTFDQTDDAVATLFTNGGSQAVRLPKAFRFPGKAVRARRLPGGRVLLEPLKKASWPKGYWDRLASLPEVGDQPARAAELPPDTRRDELIASLGARRTGRRRRTR